MNRKEEILSRYLPGGTAPLIVSWIDRHEVAFKISRARSTRLGDYRHPFKSLGHRISVNYNLNPYSFLVTTVHEFAHLECWNKYKNKVSPHGPEWKAIFRDLLKPFVEDQVFPDSLSKALNQYLKNPAASSCTDLNLMRTLSLYDQVQENQTTVESLPVGAAFKMPDGRLFIKCEKLRKRYRCVEQATKRQFLFHALAKVYVG